MMFRSIAPPLWIRDLAGAWTFYTVLPQWEWAKPSYKRIARFAPCIGLFIGTLQSLIWSFLEYFDWASIPVSLISVALCILITGGLHLDGLMDTADGLAAGKQQCFEAMDDSRIGASGIQAVLIITLLQIAALSRLDSLAPLAFPVAAFWGRWSPIWAINKFPYLRSNGTASFHRENRKGLEDVIPSSIALGVLFVSLVILQSHTVNTYLIAAASLLGLFPAIAIPQLMGKHLGGHTGDTYGACVVLVETITLLILALLF